MAFTDFKTLTAVCRKFNYDVEYINFVKETDFLIDNFFLDYIKENLKDKSSFLNEYVICEDIIKPIIKVVARKNKLPIWSHIPLNVTEELSGIPDYIFAPAYPGNQEYKLPIACLGVAKKDKFAEGWGQTAAEMVAAQIANNNKDVPIYGLVTNGTVWEFGKLIGNMFSIEERPFSVENLNHIFNVLNWFFCEARNSADALLELESSKNIVYNE